MVLSVMCCDIVKTLQAGLARRNVLSRAMDASRALRKVMMTMVC